MSKKTKWVGAGAVALAAIAAVWFTTRGDDADSIEPPHSEAPAATAASDAGRAAEAPAAEDAGIAESASDAGLPAVHSVTYQAPPQVLPYRPSHLLVYSEYDVSQNPADDAASPIPSRIIDLVHADSAQAEAIRKAWGKHEDARRTLWKSAYKRESGPRILNHDGLAAADFDFQTALLGSVLNKEQGQRLLQELPAGGVQPQQTRLYTPEERRAMKYHQQPQ